MDTDEIGYLVLPFLENLPSLEGLGHSPQIFVASNGYVHMVWKVVKKGMEGRSKSANSS